MLIALSEAMEPRECRRNDVHAENKSVALEAKCRRVTYGGEELFEEGTPSQSSLDAAERSPWFRSPLIVKHGDRVTFKLAARLWVLRAARSPSVCLGSDQAALTYPG
jgi:hypothetical protein